MPLHPGVHIFSFTSSGYHALANILAQISAIDREVMLPRLETRLAFPYKLDIWMMTSLLEILWPWGRLASADSNFGSELVMKRVSKTIKLMDDVVKSNDPQSELFLLCTCVGI
ncbi:hypothetical protein Tco_0763157 [Tanacetum coccineum]